MTASLIALRDFDTSLARELLSAGAVRLGPHGKRKMDEDGWKCRLRAQLVHCQRMHCQKLELKDVKVGHMYGPNVH